MLIDGNLPYIGIVLKSMRHEFLVPAQTSTAVKLLTTWPQCLRVRRLPVSQCGDKPMALRLTVSCSTPTGLTKMTPANVVAKPACRFEPRNFSLQVRLGKPR